MRESAAKVVVFGDAQGLPPLIELLPRGVLRGIVVAALRPASHDPARSLATTHEVPLLVQPKFNTREYRDFFHQLVALSPDLIIVSSYSMLLHEDVLAVPRYGAVNIHAALLPSGRGPNPLQWAIIRGESTTGVTLHEMTPGFDEGPIIDQISVPIGFGDTWLTVRERQQVASAELLVRNLERLLSGSWISVPQDDARASRNRRRTPADGRFEWSDRVIDIYNKVRALLPPLPPAHTDDGVGGLILFSQFTTPWELASMKYGDRGGCTMVAETVRLRPLRPEDGPRFCDWIAARDSGGFVGPWLPEHDCERWLETAMTERGDMIAFAIETVADGQSIGICQLTEISWHHRCAELKVTIGDEEARGPGISAAAVRLLVAFASSELGLRRFGAQIPATHSRSIREYQSAGFSLEGVMRDAAWVDGRWTDVVVMATLQTDLVP